MSVLHKTGILIILLALLVSLAPLNAKADITVSAQSAVLMEQESGRVLYEKDAHKPLRIASITKIMTAILAIESGKLDKSVAISDRAIGTEGSSLYLKHGQKMKLEDLVYGLMLRSGNDAAVAIAEYVGGSLDGFVWLMNQKAQEIGMKDTNFSNPHGLDNTKNHYSSAYDMALLTRYAMQNKEYRKISGTKVHKAPNPTENWDYVWRNKNRLLTERYKYCTGGKTGYTKLAKRTLVTTAEKDGLELISVTLNDSNDWDDHIAMYEYGFKKYDLMQLLPAGPLKDLNKDIFKGKVFVKNSFNYPLTKKEKKKVSIKIKVLKPQKSWNDKANIPEIVGKADVMLKGKKIGSKNIFYGKFKGETHKSWIQSWKSLFLSVLGI